MSPFSLTLKKSDFYVGVSRYFGWGDGPDNDDKAWTAKQLRVLKDCVDSGCRNFYWPPPTSGLESYQWTFLTPVGEITIDTSDDVTEIPHTPFPDDFGGLLSKMTIHAGNSIYVPLMVINEARMREMYASNPSTSGRPQFAAERPNKGTNPSGPKRDLLIYPRPDTSYTFKFQYNLLPDSLSDKCPFAYGGQEHSETILESCLRTAEERYNDMLPNSGPHSMKFFELLAASISRDRAHKPHVIGYNADHSDLNERGRMWLRDYWQPVTYNSLPMGSY